MTVKSDECEDMADNQEKTVGRDVALAPSQGVASDVALAQSQGVASDVALAQSQSPCRCQAQDCHNESVNA